MTVYRIAAPPARGMGETIELTIDPVRSGGETTTALAPPETGTSSPALPAGQIEICGRRFPWWWLLVAGALGFGVAWLIFRDDDEDDDPPLG